MPLHLALNEISTTQRLLIVFHSSSLALSREQLGTVAGGHCGPLLACLYSLVSYLVTQLVVLANQLQITRIRREGKEMQSVL